MVRIYDRVDFPAKISENLKLLLDEGLICLLNNFDNGTPAVYEITEKGKLYLDQNLNDEEILEHVKNMHNPDLLLQITQAYIQRKNGL